MHSRKAASVLPEPVGADTSTSRPAAISGQARACAAVGSPNRSRNQASTSGWNGGTAQPFRGRTIGTKRTGIVSRRWMPRSVFVTIVITWKVSPTGTTMRPPGPS